MIYEDQGVEGLPDEPGADEIALTEKLGPAGVNRVDACLMRLALPQWRKVALIVVKALDEGGFESSDAGAFPLHQRRLIALIESGQLEGQGDLRQPRWSEVRLGCTT
jgi:hypothetical protein